MAGLRNLSNRAVNAMKVEKDTVYWDRRLTGFGVRIYPTGGKVYIAHARGPEGPKRIKVGRHGVLNADDARKRAALIIARIKAGEEPLPEPVTATGPTVAEVAERFRRDHMAVRLKPSSAQRLESVIRWHILPAFGNRPMGSIERKEVLALHQRMSGTPNQANRMLRTLFLMYTLSRDWGLLPAGLPSAGHNPCTGVMKYPDRKRERFLTDAEFERLGDVLRDAESRGGASASTIAAIRLLLLTGCRKSEILTLRWEHVDLGAAQLHLPDTKTGARTITLPQAAMQVLADIPKIPGNPWVIAGRKPNTHLKGLDVGWRTLRSRARLEDVRIHDLRHSYASRALALGESLPMIGKLLGHKQIETTARYAHLADDSVHASAERIAESLAEDLGIAPSDRCSAEARTVSVIEREDE